MSGEIKERAVLPLTDWWAFVEQIRPSGGEAANDEHVRLTSAGIFHTLCPSNATLKAEPLSQMVRLDTPNHDNVSHAGLAPGVIVHLVEE